MSDSRHCRKKFCLLRFISPNYWNYYLERLDKFVYTEKDTDIRYLFAITLTFT